MKPTSIRDLLIAAGLAAAVVYLLVWLLYDDLPPLPTLAGVSLALLAIGEAAFGYSLRTQIRQAPHTVQPLTAVRAVALAKASSLLGSLMSGGWLGVLAYVVPRRDDFVAAGSDTVTAFVGLVCAAALAAAGLWLEYCCRTPDDEDSRDEDRAAGNS